MNLTKLAIHAQEALNQLMDAQPEATHAKVDKAMRMGCTIIMQIEFEHPELGGPPHFSVYLREGNELMPMVQLKIESWK